MRIQFPALFQSQASQTRCAILGKCIHFTRMPRARRAFPQSWGLAGLRRPATICGAPAGGAMTNDQQIRQQIARVLDWGDAHADFRTAVDDFPEDLRSEVPSGFSRSAWELLEHMRIALWDIVEFTKDARHKSPPWPDGYWPPLRTPPQEEAWDQCIQSITDLLAEMRDLVLDRHRPLLEPFPRSQ